MAFVKPQTQKILIFFLRAVYIDRRRTEERRQKIGESPRLQGKTP
jgi:hypothetical protein